MRKHEPRRPSCEPNAPVDGSASNAKARGAFYTPRDLAQILTDWALANKPSRVLEPAFGQGVFLSAAYDALLRMGEPRPERCLFGVEIDPAGRREVLEEGLGIRSDHLLIGDLLGLEVDDLGGPFGAILGNPPYIRHHSLSPSQIARGRKSAARIGVDLNGRSDAWAYFCAHLISFLRPRGRLALVLPGSVLHADYAEPLLHSLARGQGETRLVRVKERLFSGVQERTVVLLVDRAASGGGELRFHQAADTKDLRDMLNEEAEPPTQTRRAPGDKKSPLGSHRDSPRLPWRLTKQEVRLWERLCESDGLVPLGQEVDIRIGVVTGANSFFVRTQAEIRELGRGASSVPIIGRGGVLKKPVWTTVNQSALESEPSRLLVIKPGQDWSPQLLRAIEQAEESGIHLRSHCARRDPWYLVADRRRPHAFLPYMAAEPPRLVLNESVATCTNSVHRVYGRHGSTVDLRSIVAGSWTSLFRLSAELYGRSYGGGVLKLEPSGAKKLLVPTIQEPDLLDRLASVYETNGAASAIALADHVLLVEHLGLSKAEVESLRRAARRLSMLRRH